MADHIGDRAEQQDRSALLTHAQRPGKLLAVLADGMGGRSGGQIASDQVITTAKNLFSEAPLDGQSAPELLEQIAQEAHSVVRLSALSSEKEPHSTLVALLIDRTSAFWVHAGDSRLYRFRAGQLLARTADHSYANRLAPDGSLVDGGAQAARFKNILFSAIGIGQSLRVDHGSCSDLASGDAFVLASDGFWAYFSDEEIGQVVHLASPRQAAETLIKHARQRAGGRGDNVSVVIVKLNPLPRAGHEPLASPADR
jgi:serine/threonine protein phosphatase PrpC